MKALLKTQRTLQANLAQAISNHKKTGHARRTEGYLTGRIANVEAGWKKFLENHEQIYILEDDASDQELELVEDYETTDLYSKFEETYIEFLGDLHDGLAQIQQSQHQQVHVQVPPSEGTVVRATEKKLPAMELPKFNGNFSDWRKFRESFTSMIHDDPHIPLIQKLQYLRSCLSGEPQRLLDLYDVSGANYQAAWDEIFKRYDNKRVLVTTHLKALLTQTNIVKESERDLKDLLDTTKRRLHELATLGSPVQHWDQVVVCLLTARLPEETKRIWEQRIATSAEHPALNTMFEFLEERFRIHEALRDGKVTQSKHREMLMPKKSSTYHTSEHKNCSICKGQHLIYQCGRLKRVNSNERRKILIKYGICLNCIQRHEGSCIAGQECPLCRQDHKLHRCDRFLKLARTDKRDVVQAHNLCGNCLRPHPEFICPYKGGCYKCHRRHHTWLHEDANAPPNPNPTTGTTTATACATRCNLHKKNTQALLATATVLVKGQPLRALIDLGSQSSFISQSAYQALKLKGSPASLNVTGLEYIKVAQATKSTIIRLRSSVTPNFELPVEAYVIKKITSVCPPTQYARHNWDYIQGLKLADPQFLDAGAIDMLLGVKVYAKIICSKIKKGPTDAPIAQKTKLGWILFGEIVETSHQEKNNLACMATTEASIEQLNKQIRLFWESEEIQGEQRLTEEEQQCEDFYQKTHKRLVSGQYEVRIPFKQNPQLGDSKRMGTKRFEHTERKILQQPKMGDDYRKCLNEYLTLNHMNVINYEEPVTMNKAPRYYMPHHAVIKESTTTKLRVVFDASAKSSNGKSINEQMMTGPTLQPKLYATLLKWRKHKYAVTADIEKMYRMILVHKDDRKFQSILWRNHPNESIQTYELNTVTFGTTAAPYLAIRTLQQVAKDEEKEFPQAAQIALQDFYVDDVLTGANSLEETKQIQQQLTDMLNRGGFRLRKWAANDNELLNWIPVEDREVEVPLTFKEDGQIKALGIQWHPYHDHFAYAFKSQEFEEPATTKRRILSQIAKLFDPLGWIAPCVVAAKVIIQKLWMAGCSWDQEVPSEYSQEWEELKTQLIHIREIKVPRWVHVHSSQVNMQLHGFCDASMAAYAAVVYIRIIDENQNIHVSLLMAKTKVAPIKPITLPRLELCGAVLLSRLLQQVKTDMQLGDMECHSWTDSKIALAWIKSHPRRWRTFVANRTAEIQENSLNNTWKYVPSQDNPADVASRGILPKNLLRNSLWWTGPSWLGGTADMWPRDTSIKNDITLEMANVKSLTTQEQHNEVGLIEKFSNYRRLVRVTAYCLRFVNNAKQGSQKRTGVVQAMEIESAKIRVLRLAQRCMFPREQLQLKNTGRVDKQSKLYKLDPFLDEHQILRVGGRLRSADLSYDIKNPILLQPRTHITNIIIDRFHLESLHGGPQLVLNIIRNEFRIINGLNVVKYRVHRCITCTRYRPHVQQQIMGDLPMSRVTQAHPFQNSGVDYAGPITLRMSKHRGAKTYKGYICIFVCMATKAIHIEAASDLTTEAFVAAFRRFIGRRGMCSNMYSDNGTNFIGADKVFKRTFKEVFKSGTEATAKEYAERGLTWHFIPPSAPHFGGLWEATVKSTKHHLRRTVKSSNLTFEELNTLLVQIEACLNSRPIQALSSDPNCMEALTPGHFLIGRPLVQPAEPTQHDRNSGVADRWKQIQILRQVFWKRWSQEYLLQLQQRTKWNTPQQNIRIGQMVILKDERQPPASWQLGRIVKTHPGDDDRVRVVTVKTTTAILQRPIQKVIPVLT